MSTFVKLTFLIFSQSLENKFSTCSSINDLHYLFLTSELCSNCSNCNIHFAPDLIRRFPDVGSQSKIYQQCYQQQGCVPNSVLSLVAGSKEGLAGYLLGGCSCLDPVPAHN